MRWVWLALVVGCRIHFDDLPSRSDASSADADAFAGDAPAQLEIIVSGYGAVVGPGIACADDCTYSLSQPVTLSAVAGEAWGFQGFGAPCSGTTCTIANAATLTATFTQLPITANRVFITSATTAQNVGAAAFDTMCGTAATGAGLTGTYVAYVSTTAKNAVDKLAGKRGWVRMDGLPFLDQTSAIGSPLPRGAVYDEHGAVNGSFTPTGSTNSGVLQASENCSNWSVTTSASVAGAGGHYGDIAALGGYSSTCNFTLQLLCFETDFTVAVPIAPPPFPVGRYVFTSHNTYTLAGIAAADTQCQSDATAAGLPGTYVAFVATTTQSASDRIGGVAGIWRRSDGLVVTRTGLDQSPLDTAAFLDATGHEPVLNAGIWFGANTATELGTSQNTCNDYSDSALPGTSLWLDSYDQDLLVDVGTASNGCSNPTVGLMCAQTM